MKKIRIGIIGAGWITRQHLQVIQNIRHIKVEGITSRTMEKARKLAHQFHIPICVKSLSSLINKTNLDALMVLVSADQTFKVTSHALTFGLPVFIEKPAGLTPRENLSLVRLAKKYSTKTMVGFNRRYYSIFHKGINIIQKHGPLFGVTIEGHERIWNIKKNKKFSKKILNHWIYANNIHMIDLCRFFGGEPKKIIALSRRFSEYHGDQFSALFTFSRQMTGIYNAHWYSPGGWRVVLYGNGVTVEFNPLEKGLWIDKNLKKHFIQPAPEDLNFKPGFFRQMKAFYQLILGNKDPYLQGLEGAYKSMVLAKTLCKNIENIKNIPKKI